MPSGLQIYCKLSTLDPETTSEVEVLESGRVDSRLTRSSLLWPPLKLHLSKEPALCNPLYHLPKVPAILNADAYKSEKQDLGRIQPSLDFLPNPGPACSIINWVASVQW